MNKEIITRPDFFMQVYSFTGRCKEVEIWQRFELITIGVFQMCYIVLCTVYIYFTQVHEKSNCSVQKIEITVTKLEIIYYLSNYLLF